MTSAGLLGFPNVGKTTLFNALTGLEAFTAPHPYTTTQPRIGTVRMPDRVLGRLAALEGSRKVTHAGLDLVDLPAVRSGSIRGLGAGREPDLLLAVLRAHDSEAVPVGEHPTDPAGQADDLLVEVALSDLEVFERRNERLTKEAAADPRLRPVAEAVTRAAERLGEGVPLRQAAWSDMEVRAFRDMAPLSLLPCVWVVNVAEDDGGHDMVVGQVREVVPSTDPVLAVSALIEEEVAGLEASQRAEVYEGLGLGEARRPGSCGRPTTLSGWSPSTRSTAGSPGRGPFLRGPRRGKPPARSTPIWKEASSGPRWPPSGMWSDAAAGRRPGPAAPCGSRARTTRSGTGT